LVKESGGVYVNFKGEEIKYANALQRTKENFEFIAIAPQFLDEILEVVRTFNDERGIN
jgi:fructose-1,6-bisphosphatase/inositol monophosphatase family enzyme